MAVVDADAQVPEYCLTKKARWRLTPYRAHKILDCRPGKRSVTRQLSSRVRPALNSLHLA